MKSTLYLIPNTLGHTESIPEYVKTISHSLTVFVVEYPKAARKFLKSIDYPHHFDDVHFFHIEKHGIDLTALTHFFLEHKDVPIGLLSDAGNPCIADPGSEVVRVARSMGKKIHPLVGPSSILLALIASGLNGQQFAFHGYLPIQSDALIRKLKAMEKAVETTGYTQLFMETPYRNNKLLDVIFRVAKPTTYLSIASDLTLETEFVETKSIQEWKQMRPDIHKRPTIFLMGK